MGSFYEIFFYVWLAKSVYLEFAIYMKIVKNKNILPVKFIADYIDNVEPWYKRFKK